MDTGSFEFFFFEFLSSPGKQTTQALLQSKPNIDLTFSSHNGPIKPRQSQSMLDQLNQDLVLNRFRFSWSISRPGTSLHGIPLYELEPIVLYVIHKSSCYSQTLMLVTIPKMLVTIPNFSHNPQCQSQSLMFRLHPNSLFNFQIYLS